MSDKVMTFLFEGRDVGLTAMMKKVSSSSLSMSQKMAAVGKTMTQAITVPIVGAAVASVKLAMDFQTSMTKVQALTGVSQKQMTQWSAGILNMAKTTGHAPNELAKALYFVASAGFRGKAALDVLEASAKAAASGLGDTATVADAVTSVLNAYKGTGLKAADVTDTLVAAVTQGKMPVDALAGAIGSVIPVSSILGIKFSEVAAMAAITSRSGANVARTMTGLRYMMSSLINPTSTAAKILAGVGLSAEGVAKEMKGQGLIATLETLKAKLPLPEFLKVVGGARGVAVALNMVKNGGKDAASILDKVEHSSGDTNKAFAITSQTLKFKMNVALASLESAGISVGAKLIPTLTKVATWVGMLAQKFTALPKPMQDMIVKILLVAAVIGPLILISAKMVMAFKTLKGAVEAFGIASKLAALGNPWVLLAVAIALIAVLIITHWKTIMKWGMDCWNAIKSAAEVCWKYILKGWQWFWTTFQPIIKVIETAAKIMWLIWSTEAKIAWDIISGIVLLAWAIIKPIIKAYAALATWLFKTIIMPIAKIAWQVVIDVVKAAWKIIQPILKFYGLFFKLTFDAMKAVAKVTWDAIIGVVKTAWKLIQLAIKGVWVVIETVFGWILHAAASAFGWIPGLGGKLKAAAKTFDTFKANVNRALSGINNKTVKVNVKMTSATNPYPGGISGRAAFGGPIRGPGGPTEDKAGLFALSNNEYVMPAAAHRHYGTKFMDSLRARKFAGGGATQFNVEAGLPSMQSIMGPIGGLLGHMALNFAKTMGGSLGAMLSYAESFVGKVPYVWGGTSTRGWDCSGFMQYVMEHFGYHPPRVASDQQLWAQRSGNVPGALVFFGQPAYHVGMSLGNSMYVGADDPSIGTAIRGLGGNSGFGVPPGAGGPAGGIPGTSGNVASWLEQAMRADGKPNSWLRYMETLVQKESGGDPHAYNPSGASGLCQMKPGTYARWATLRGGIWNPVSNAAASMRYITATYGAPWNIPGLMGGYYPGYKGGGPVRFDTGYGTLRPGYNLAYNGTGKNEHLGPAGGATVINIYPKMLVSDKRQLARELTDVLEQFRGKGGRLAK
jgi:TP901 family phage tail tape measure protein